MPSCAGHGNTEPRSATVPRQHFLYQCSLVQSCQAQLLIGYNPCRIGHIPWQRCSWVQLSCPHSPWSLQCKPLVVQQAPPAQGGQAWATDQLTLQRQSQSLLLQTGLGCLAVVRSCHNGTSMRNLNCRREGNDKACPKDGSKAPLEWALSAQDVSGSLL